MPMAGDWKISPSAQPKPGDYSYDLDSALAAVVGLRSTIPADAFTADTLGTERAGNGVLINRDGLVLTIGYLITEAESVWVHLGDGRAVPGHVLGFDQVTGFGLVQALAKLDLPALPLGDSDDVKVGDRAVLAGGGGRSHSVVTKIAAKQEFAGYWEYVLDEAIIAAPAHPNWGGTALIGSKGNLLGVGSLQLERKNEGLDETVNMVVPVNLLKPILDDLTTYGHRRGPVRPWLGLYAADMDDRIVVMGLANNAPAQRAGLQTGDLLLEVAGSPVKSLAGLFRKVWSLGDAGVEVPVKAWREGRTFDAKIVSSDRAKFLKRPRIH
jgi:S1-C subfamily serine protease